MELSDKIKAVADVIGSIDDHCNSSSEDKETINDSSYVNLKHYDEDWRKECSKRGYWIDIYKPWEDGDGPGSGSPFD